jgi:methionyl-tRNA formyltransferase
MSSEPNQTRGRVLLVGLGPTAATALEALAERFAVVGLVRQVAAGVADPVIARACRLGVRIIPVATIPAIEAAVNELRPDCVVVSSFHRILPDALLARCPFVNVHYALLPKYRGRANVNWAILNGEKATGISIHEMAPGLDAGNILFQAEVPIGADDDVTTLYERLNELQRTGLAGAVERLLSGNRGEAQDASQATYGCTRLPDDGEIDWSASTASVYALVRSLTAPFPGAFTYFEGKRLIVWRARPVAEAPQYDGRIPGRVACVSRAEGSVDVLTGDGVVRVLEVQREGAERTAAANVIGSVKATLGLRTSELLRRIEQLERQVSGLLKTEIRARSSRDEAWVPEEV